MTEKQKSIGLLVICEVFTLALWFSASATIPDLKREFGISDLQASLFSSMVSVGFVCGTLTSAIFGLADRLPPQRFFMMAALIGAVSNAMILLIDPASPMVLVARFFTGAIMAGVYPVGMKMAASWAEKDMGLLVGTLVGALTLGSAMPHFFNALGGLDWRTTIGAASLSAVVGGLLINLVKTGPDLGKSPKFQPGFIFHAWKDKPLRFANFGYFGHMWELYAKWAWIGVFLLASFELSELEKATSLASAATFAIIGSGAVGCFAGGWLADRIGRTWLTMGAMTISGTCALVVGMFFGGNPVLLMIICIIWGISIVADSAQFSSCIMELSHRDHIGTMVTMQTCIGFLLTLTTIHLVPVWVDQIGWEWAFAPLAIGPFFGVWAMGRLRGMPEAVKIAHGKR
ncbi:MFS transporter [Terasakiella sp. A23]|uniref:MFS transporter n=1 Tax=Terasakiella sp. FCG-A23 TaxID=3080561 RepID=UPI002953AAFA|nr:MFS transporter [Terasakiella sp. A23]MDV7338337.1 MFS transporter [Terasakiella sp. A23]